jgi:hypothetical protein
MTEVKLGKVLSPGHGAIQRTVELLGKETLSGDGCYTQTDAMLFLGGVLQIGAVLRFETPNKTIVYGVVQYFRTPIESDGIKRNVATQGEVVVKILIPMKLELVEPLIGVLKTYGSPNSFLQNIPSSDFLLREIKQFHLHNDKREEKNKVGMTCFLDLTVLLQDETDVMLMMPVKYIQGVEKSCCVHQNIYTPCTRGMNKTITTPHLSFFVSLLQQTQPETLMQTNLFRKLIKSVCLNLHNHQCTKSVIFENVRRLTLLILQNHQTLGTTGVYNMTLETIGKFDLCHCGNCMTVLKKWNTKVTTIFSWIKRSDDCLERYRKRKPQSKEDVVLDYPILRLLQLIEDNIGFNCE